MSVMVFSRKMSGGSYKPGTTVGAHTAFSQIVRDPYMYIKAAKLMMASKQVRECKKCFESPASLCCVWSWLDCTRRTWNEKVWRFCVCPSWLSCSGRHDILATIGCFNEVLMYQIDRLQLLWAFLYSLIGPTRSEVKALLKPCTWASTSTRWHFAFGTMLS